MIKEEKMVAAEPAAGEERELLLCRRSRVDATRGHGGAPASAKGPNAGAHWTKLLNLLQETGLTANGL